MKGNKEAINNLYQHFNERLDEINGVNTSQSGKIILRIKKEIWKAYFCSMELINYSGSHLKFNVCDQNGQKPNSCKQVIMKRSRFGYCYHFDSASKISYWKGFHLIVVNIWQLHSINLQSLTRWSGRAEEQESPPRGRDRQGPRRVSASRQRWDQRPVGQAEGEDRRDRLALRQEREARGEPEGAQRKAPRRHGEEQDGQLE